jgi:hypothetical protein
MNHRNYDSRDFVRQTRQLRAILHIARPLERRDGTAIDSRTTRPPGYALSIKARQLIDELGKDTGFFGGQRCGAKKERVRDPAPGTPRECKGVDPEGAKPVRRCDRGNVASPSKGRKYSEGHNLEEAVLPAMERGTD